MNRTARRPRISGLSLLEVMVTVAIFAMLFGVLMAGWHQSMKAQTQLSSAADAIQRRQHLSVLLRQMVAETLNPQAKSGLRFMGNSQGFAAETTSSMLTSVGHAPVDMELKWVPEADGGRLSVSHQGQNSGSFAWQFDRFTVRYVDHTGEAHDTWPPARRQGQTVSPGMDTEQLPALVAFSFRFRGDAQVQQLLAAPRNTAWELAEPSSPIGGLEMP